MQKFEKINRVSGTIEYKGDKSISHRAVIFACMADGISKISNLSGSEDVNSTAGIFKSLGCEINNEGKDLIIKGRGYKGFKATSSYLDAGNSGTTARLLSGLLMNQNFSSTMIGDESLSQRPMKRIIEPLRQMGGNFFPTDENTLPMRIEPSNNIAPINYVLPIPSAQIKSAIVLSALHLDEPSTIIENLPSRNHTELMLNLRVEQKDSQNIITASKKNYPNPFEIFVPGDISSAAFFIVLTLLSKDSELTINNVSLNPQRAYYVELLKQMGADIEIQPVKSSLGEPIGNLIVRSSKLKNITIPASAIPLIIDELPILTICGLMAEGDFEFLHAAELRVKESDRISAMVKNLRALGVEVEEFPDGLHIVKSENQLNESPVFDSFGDHRIAMSFGILSLILESGGSINNFECVNISNPDFVKQIQGIVK